MAKNVPFVEAKCFKVNFYHWFNLLRLLNFSKQILSLGLKRCFRWRFRDIRGISRMLSKYIIFVGKK